MIETIVKVAVDFGMATGPILGYISQYRLIKSAKSIGSFSIDICGILLFANILRLNFYIFKQYQTALVFQSLFMIIMQIILLRECMKYHPLAISEAQTQKSTNIGSEEIQPALTEQKQCKYGLQNFWRWSKFQKYGVAIMFFIFCTFTTSTIFKFTPLATQYGEFVGVVALISQSILILPQILRNIEKQSTKGLSHTLVALNLTGDILKLVYFIANNQPFQFILCGIIQVILDSFVVIQILYYSYNENNDSQIESKQSPQTQNAQQIPQSESNLNKNSNQNGNKKQLKIIKSQSQQTKSTSDKITQKYSQLQQEIESDEQQNSNHNKNKQNKITKNQRNGTNSQNQAQNIIQSKIQPKQILSQNKLASFEDQNQNNHQIQQ